MDKTEAFDAWARTVFAYLIEKHNVGLCLLYRIVRNPAIRCEVIFQYVTHTRTHYAVLLPGARALDMPPRGMVLSEDLRWHVAGRYDPWRITPEIYYSQKDVMTCGIPVTGKLEDTDTVFGALRLCYGHKIKG